ncbi:hypothetical protein ACGFNQ_07715 [Streptomyces asoensis]|uniref:hypothetical protein n=1 Tax=Streptomyces asoensis TaxID=249586 RepID=UPI00371E3E3D
MSPDLLPPVAPDVTAGLVEALSPRLRKRLDAGIAKLVTRPVTREGDTVRIAVDDDTDLELHAPGGSVTRADAIRCGCLLAPDCLHRAAAASAAPIAEDAQDADTGTGTGTGTGTPDETAAAPSGSAPADGSGTAADGSAPDGTSHDGIAPTGPPSAGTSTVGAPGDSPDDAFGSAPAAPDGDTSVTAHGRTRTRTPLDAPDGPSRRQGDAVTAPPRVPETVPPAQLDAARAVFDAAAAVLEAGTDGSGAVVQAALLRAAHTARLAGLPRIAASAVSVVNGTRAARTADPAHRLAALAEALRTVLGMAHRLPFATGADLAELRGTVRMPYTPDGSLRLYGLFSEPVLTTTGYAGAVTWTADAEGRLYTVSDVAPGGPGRATGAAGRTVRIGDTALTHRELSRAGLAVSGATVSPTGRLGAGAGVRAVRASGAEWTAEPLDRLWTVPVAEQVARALSGGHDLLFLDVTLGGAVRGSTGDDLLAECDGLAVGLATAHDDPALPYRDNLRLLSAVGGARLRVVARLVPGPLPRALLLAAGHPSSPGTRLDLGLDRLQHADLPAAPAPAATEAPQADEAPLHLLRRRVHQAVSGGRRVLAFPDSGAGDGGRLRNVGLVTAADLLDELRSAAADRSRDAFGRLLPADPGRFARAWLASAVYTDEVERALCAAAWGAPH